MPRDQRESQAAAETSGSSAETTEDATVGDDRTTHEANTVAEEHSALQAENQNLFEYAQSLQQHVDQLDASLRENDERPLAIEKRALQVERENKALEERVAGLSVIETEHRKLLDRAQGLKEAQERSAILLQQKDDELRTSSREQEVLARQIPVEAEVKVQLGGQVEDLMVTTRQHEELQRQIPNMNKLEARNSSLQHEVGVLKKALRTHEETIKGGEPMLGAATESRCDDELRTRADVIGKLEESNAALQQKRLTEGRVANARHAHRKSRAGTGSTDGRREDAPS